MLATPTQWVAAALVIMLTALALSPSANHLQPPPDAYGRQANYFVTLKFGLTLSLPASMVLFALLYLALDFSIAAPRRRGARLAHLGLMLGGALLILSLPLLPRLTGLPENPDDIAPLFRFLSSVAVVGYALMIAGLVVFAFIVVDALVHRRPLAEPA